MGRRKKESFYQLLQRRIREHNEADAAKLAAKAKTDAEPATPRKNGEYCKNYRKRHPEAAKNAAKKWFEQFKQEHGMSYATWYYRKKHGLL